MTIPHRHPPAELTCRRERCATWMTEALKHRILDQVNQHCAWEFIQPHRLIRTQRTPITIWLLPTFSEPRSQDQQASRRRFIQPLPRLESIRPILGKHGRHLEHEVHKLRSVHCGSLPVLSSYSTVTSDGEFSKVPIHSTAAKSTLVCLEAN